MPNQDFKNLIETSSLLLEWEQAKEKETLNETEMIVNCQRITQTNPQGEP